MIIIIYYVILSDISIGENATYFKESYLRVVELSETEALKFYSIHIHGFSMELCGSLIRYRELIP